jgi:type I restriction enzyme, S subunit
VDASEFITHAGFASTSTKMMSVGTTLIAITGATLGQVSYLGIEACGSQNVGGVTPKDAESAAYTFHALSEAIGEIVNRAMGGAQQHINRGITCEALLRWPEPDVLQAFRALAQPVLEEQIALLKMQRCLRAVRNLLLPRLISGEIDVTDLDIAVPEVAA